MFKFFTTTAIAVLAVSSAASVSAETYEGDVKGMGMNASTVHPIADGHALIQSQTIYDSFEVAVGHPLEGATGVCFGAIMVKGADVSGGGNCVLDTAAGEKAVTRWTVTGIGGDGALTGDWSVAGGTGGWENASGGGGFSSLTNPDSGAFVNTISGEITVE